MHQPPPAPPIVVLTFVDRLVAVNMHTGQHIWEYPTEVTRGGRVFVDQGIVIYTGTNTIHCIDYLTGQARWKAPNNLGYTVANMLVFAGCVLMSATGNFVCLNAQNGAQLWQEKFTHKTAIMGGNALAAPGVAAQVDKTS